MQHPFASLLANLELIRATHPELKSPCIFLQTWLELAVRGRVPLDTLPSQSWLADIMRLSPLATIKLFEAIPVEQRQAPGFSLFDEAEPVLLTDGRESILMAYVAGFHPCLARVATAVKNEEHCHYLIDGAYWSGKPLPPSVDDPRLVILITVREPSRAPYVLPMLRDRIQILKGDGARGGGCAAS